MTVVYVWKNMGYSSILYTATLEGISPDYYEAAEIDGAGKVRCFFYITLPLLTPMVFFNIVMTIINAFQAFTPAYIISNGTGSHLDSTLFYTLYLYIKAFRQFSMGYASAMAWVLLLATLLLTLLVFRFVGKKVYYEA